MFAAVLCLPLQRTQPVRAVIVQFTCMQLYQRMHCFHFFALLCLFFFATADDAARAAAETGEGVGQVAGVPLLHLTAANNRQVSTTANCHVSTTANCHVLLLNCSVASLVCTPASCAMYAAKEGYRTVFPCGSLVLSVVTW